MITRQENTTARIDRPFSPLRRLLGRLKKEIPFFGESLPMFPRARLKRSPTPGNGCRVLGGFIFAESVAPAAPFARRESGIREIGVMRRDLGEARSSRETRRDEERIGIDHDASTTNTLGVVGAL